jgi:holin (3TMs family)
MRLIRGPARELADAALGVVDKLTTSEDERLKAKLEIVKLTNDFQVKLMEAETDFATQQASVITAEAKSESWMARNWRPTLMLTFTYVIAHNYIVAPMFSLPSLTIVPDMWELLKIGMGGYIAGRTFEKVAPSIAEAITSKK